MSTQFSKVYAYYVWKKEREIWLQKCKMGRKNNAMHVNPKHKWCMKKKIGQKSKNWKFSSFDRPSINRMPIELGQKSCLQNMKFSTDRKTNSIDPKFKNNRFNCSSTNWIVIEPGRELAFKNLQFLTNWKSHSINWDSGKLNFLKNWKFFYKINSKQEFSCM